MKKRKKFKPRYDRIAAALLVLAAILVAIYFFVIGAISLFNKFFGEESVAEAEVKMQVELTPEMLRCDSVMVQRIDSLMQIPQRLDTSNIAISVYDATTQMQIYSRHDTASLAPASCMKLVTAVTALKTLGMDHRFYESLLVRGEMHRDTLVGTLLLRADDDPLLESFQPLFAKMKKRGIRHVRGNIILTLAREDTLRAHPTAKTWDIPYHKTPLLLRGKKYIERQFRYAMISAGIGFTPDETVDSRLAKGVFGNGKYHYVTQTSNALRDVITPMLIYSSNIKADALFYHLDRKAGLCPERRQQWDGPHFTEAFMRQNIDTLSSISSPVTVYRDGSGLSPENRLTARLLIDVLRYAYDDQKLRDYFVNEALASPYGGPRCGSLMTRMCRPEYKNRLFVKTGTLTTIGTSSLAGYLIGNDGHWYIFSIINSDSPVAEARIFQDRLCKAMMK